jgi:hypothetical protein
MGSRLAIAAKYVMKVGPPQFEALLGRRNCGRNDYVA